MRIISIIEDEENIKKILQHLNLWEIQNHYPPNNYNIPPEYKYLIEKNIVSFGSKENANIKNLDSFSNYDNCDPMPNYEEWF